jgi:hypothetical protein
LGSLRDKIANSLLVISVLVARLSFVIGLIVGCICGTARGFALSVVIGAVVSFWMRRSLGLRGRDLTRGFFVRMQERRMGSSPRLLESLIERIRARPMTPHQCGLLAGAYAEFQRDLQSCDSITERDKLGKNLKQKARSIYSGKP